MRDPSQELDESDLVLIGSFKAVPEERRKGARVMNDRYYYGGQFYSTRPEDLVDAL